MELIKCVFTLTFNSIKVKLHVNVNNLFTSVNDFFILLSNKPFCHVTTFIHLKLRQRDETCFRFLTLIVTSSDETLFTWK